VEQAALAYDEEARKNLGDKAKCNVSSNSHDAPPITSRIGIDLMPSRRQFDENGEPTGLKQTGGGGRGRDSGEGSERRQARDPYPLARQSVDLAHDEQPMTGCCIRMPRVKSET
jgi:hypothetical protein